MRLPLPKWFSWFRLQDRIDPVTGDKLNPGEQASWWIQHRMRRWSFLGIITFITVVCWATRNVTVLTWWNLAASYGALVIEGVTAMALIQQTLRDAVVSRETRATSKRVEKMEQEHGAMLRDLYTHICGPQASGSDSRNESGNDLTE